MAFNYYFDDGFNQTLVIRNHFIILILIIEVHYNFTYIIYPSCRPTYTQHLYFICQFVNFLIVSFTGHTIFYLINRICKCLHILINLCTTSYDFELCDRTQHLFVDRCYRVVVLVKIFHVDWGMDVVDDVGSFDGFIVGKIIHLNNNLYFN